MGYRGATAVFVLLLSGLLLYVAGYRAGLRGSPGPRETSRVLARTDPRPSQRDLTLPIAGLRPQDIPDTFNQARGSHRHEATDIMAPRGTPVRAVCDGVIRKLFVSKAGGNTIYQFDEAGVYCYYYAHLDRYAEGLDEGQKVEKGQVIGYVGSTGNASPDAPHLHFAIFELGPEKEWWRGTPIDPYPILLNLAENRKADFH